MRKGAGVASAAVELRTRRARRRHHRVAAVVPKAKGKLFAKYVEE